MRGVLKDVLSFTMAIHLLLALIPVVRCFYSTFCVLVKYRRASRLNIQSFLFQSVLKPLFGLPSRPYSLHFSSICLLTPSQSPDIVGSVERFMIGSRHIRDLAMLRRLSGQREIGYTSFKQKSPTNSGVWNTGVDDE